MISWQAKVLNSYLRAAVKWRLGYYAKLLEYGKDSQALAKFRHLLELAPKPPSKADTKLQDLAGLQCRWIKSKHIQPDLTILYLHGGGYVAGSAETYANLGYHLAKAAQAQVIIPNYHLAPEYKFPAAVEDAVAVCTALYEQGYSAQNLIIAGDSAGGGLALAALLSLRDANLPLPAGAVLLSPWVDLALTGQSLIVNRDADPMLIMPNAAFYLGDQDPYHPLASPLYADLQGLPPLQILVGSTEILLNDATRLADKAKGCGVSAELQIWPEMPHVWPLFADFVPEAKQALAEVSRFIKGCLSNSF